MKSIISSDKPDACFICGRNRNLQVHHIFGGPVRKTSDRYGLTVHLCMGCHDSLHGKYGNEAKQYLHRIGQQAYEEQIGTREQFIKEFISSYL